MEKLRNAFKNYPFATWLVINVIVFCSFWFFIFFPNIVTGTSDWSDMQYFSPGLILFTIIIGTFVWWIAWRQLTKRQSYLRNAFIKRPWLSLGVTNIILFGLVWLAGVLAIGFGIGESYHPDAYVRSLFPTAGVIFGVFGVALILSLLWWVKYRSVTTKRCFLFGAVTVLSALVSGTMMYLSTEEKSATRTYEFLGSTYEIPREYSPSMYTNKISGKAALSIDVCGQDPLVGEYDQLAKQAIEGSCEQGTHMIQPLIRGLPSYFDFALQMSLRDGRYGFTVATATDIARLNPIKLDDLDGTRTKVVTKDNMTIIMSRDGGLHKDNYYLEFVDNKLQWVTVCSLWNCQNHAAFPYKSGYWLRADAHNRAQYDRGHLTEQEIAEYKQLHQDVYNLFNSFVIDSQ